MSSYALLVVSLALGSITNIGAATSSPAPEVVTTRFIEANCLDCHDDEKTKGELNLERLPFTPENSKNRQRWIQIFDRINKREMPPKDERLPEKERSDLLSFLEDALVNADLAELASKGRGSLRRLTRGEFEHNLQDLLQLPHLDIRDRLPSERTSAGFTKVSTTLDMSRVQWDAFLNATESALIQAIASGTAPIESSRYQARGTDLYPKLNVHAGHESMHFSKRGSMVAISNADLKHIQETGEHDPELEMALFRSATWPFYGYPRRFLATHNGAYRVRFSARAVRQLPGFRLVSATAPVPMTFRARQPSAADVSGDVRATGGLLDIQPTASVFETTIRLKAGETFEYSLLGLPVPHPITSHGGPLYYNFPPMPPEGHRGVAFQWLEVEGPSPPTEWPPASHRILFGDLPLSESSPDSDLPIKVLSQAPLADAERLMIAFADKASRQPLSPDDTKSFINLIHTQLTDGTEFTRAILIGYKAFLCSSHFLYLREPQPKTNDTSYALANRLSHFLWNSRPDQKLSQRADKDELTTPTVLRDEIRRLIKDERFERFVVNFTDEWLDLNQLLRDTPDIRLFPEYRKDDYLIKSMERETRTYFKQLIRENQPITALIDSQFACINDRLARHYGFAPVKGSAIRKITLPDQSPYGGLLTQGAIMKVTSNGTSTSPVIRGAWVMTKLLGDPPPKPPTSVPAVEPDIRGATTVREILAAHTETKSCANCHARFDPIGFALENFDIMGAWRDYYRGLEKGFEITGIDRAGHAFAYRIAQPVDASGQLLNGDTFQNVRDLKRILVTRPRPLAQNLLHQWTLYATGAPVRFSDRRIIDTILDDCDEKGYRIGDLFESFIQSRIFTGDLRVANTQN